MTLTSRKISEWEDLARKATSGLYGRAAFNDASPEIVLALIQHVRELESKRDSGGGGKDWVRVPREPTPEMIEAWAEVEDYGDHPVEYYLNPRRYRAMISAAPSDEGEKR